MSQSDPKRRSDAWRQCPMWGEPPKARHEFWGRGAPREAVVGRGILWVCWPATAAGCHVKLGMAAVGTVWTNRRGARQNP